MHPLLVRLPGGELSLAEWKLKISLVDVAAGVIDKRKTNGLRQACKRLTEKKVKIAQSTMLKAYLNQVDQIMQLVPSNVPSLTTGKLHELIEIMLGEGLEIPDSVKLALTQRYVSEMMGEKQWSKLLASVSPFSEGVFSYKAPTVSGLAESPENKAKLFQKVVFNDLLAPKVLEGELCSEDVFRCCSCGLELFKGIDVVMLDQFTAVIYDEAQAVFRALAAILKPTLQTHLASQAV